VLDFEEPLLVEFETNDLFKAGADYLLQVRLKEKVLHQRLVKPKNNQIVEISAKDFATVNGGVMSVALFKLTQAFYDNYDTALE
jgi:hypothetical protein